MKLVVGLGNPGPQYAGTRHNVGFDTIDYLASDTGSAQAKFDALITKAQEGDETVLYAKPMTYMNLSGLAVRQILDFYKVPVESLFVVCDDFNLPLGKLRIRAKGSAGGQNGLKSVAQVLGTTDFARLRIGVGAPTHGDAVDHVLGKFRPAERAVKEEAVATAGQAVLVWVRAGLDACMNRFNGPADVEKEKGKGKKAKEKPDEKNENDRVG
ncbi:MAG TPA: aminoacyl-tRNA hydrolase [Fimbriiglobus sp.]|jgi:PTH1 family peptidyl-tRNA hydrolase